LAKKMMIANVVAGPADQIFALPGNELRPALAWLGVLCYTLQIYFDFSGYSDMAVGLGKMFGFKFLENFNYPYISQSIKEFWRRWHISLSSWFRDYLYIPLGGNRCSELRNHLNLLIVFFLCGLWHGASWTFVLWGLYHGLFLVLERTRFGHWVEGLPRALRHLYTLLAVIAGWVLFRAETFSQALNFLANMVGINARMAASQPLTRYLSHQVICSILLGLVFSTPIWTWIKGLLAAIPERAPNSLRPAVQAGGALLELVLVMFVLFVSAAWLVGGTYNPFIYFRF
jgi:alginate O-acetyltransferase complex protein AlgI